jgi:hypothetical protein
VPSNPVVDALDPGVLFVIPQRLECRWGNPSIFSVIEPAAVPGISPARDIQQGQNAVKMRRSSSRRVRPTF